MVGALAYATLVGHCFEACLALAHGMQHQSDNMALLSIPIWPFASSSESCNTPVHIRLFAMSLLAMHGLGHRLRHLRCARVFLRDEFRSVLARRPCNIFPCPKLTQVVYMIANSKRNAISDVFNGLDGNSSVKVQTIVYEGLQAMDDWSIHLSQFVERHVAADACRRLYGLSDVRARSWGGYESAEMVRLALGPPDLLTEYDVEDEGFISALRIAGKFSFDNPKHRDFLGAMLSTVLQDYEQELGDILVQSDSSVHILTTPEMAQALIEKLGRFSSMGVIVEAISSSEVVPPSKLTADSIAGEGSMRFEMHALENGSFSFTYATTTTTTTTFTPKIRSDKYHYDDYYKLDDALKSVHRDYRQEVMQVLQKALFARDAGTLEVTKFLEPPIVADIIRILPKHFHRVAAQPWGGYEGAERKRLALGIPRILDAGNISDDSGIVCALSISGNFRSDKASHRDFLGALLGTGMVSRSQIGDILVQGDLGAQVLTSRSTAETLSLMLTSVRSIDVFVEIIPVSKITIPQERMNDFRTVENSMRLDALASAAFRTSRSEMSKMIKRKLVKVNWIETTKVTKLLKEGDILSVRGKGRAKITEVSSTKKGKLAVSYERYL